MKSDVSVPPSADDKLTEYLKDPSKQIKIGTTENTIAMVGFNKPKEETADGGDDGPKDTVVREAPQQIKITVDDKGSPINGTYTKIKEDNSWNNSDNNVFIRLTNENGEPTLDHHHQHLTIFGIHKGDGGEETLHKIARSQAEVTAKEEGGIDIKVNEWVKFGEANTVTDDVLNLNFEDVNTSDKDKINVEQTDSDGKVDVSNPINGKYIKTDESWVKEDGSYSFVLTQKPELSAELDGKFKATTGEELHFTLFSLAIQAKLPVPRQMSLTSKNKIDGGTVLTSIENWVNLSNEDVKLQFTPVDPTAAAAAAAAADSSAAAAATAAAAKPPFAPSVQDNWVQIANEQYDKNKSLKFEWGNDIGSKFEIRNHEDLGRGSATITKFGYPFWENDTHEISMFIKEGDPMDREWRFKNKINKWFFALKSAAAASDQWMLHPREGAPGRPIDCTVTLTKASPTEAAASQAQRLGQGRAEMGGLKIVGFDDSTNGYDGDYNLQKAEVNGYPHYKKEDGVQPRHLFKMKEHDYWIITTNPPDTDSTTAVAYVDLTGPVPVGDKTVWNVPPSDASKKLDLNVEEIPPPMSSMKGGYKRRKSTINKYKRTTKNKYKRTMKKKYKRTMKKKYKKPTIKKYKRNINNKYNRTIKKKYKRNSKNKY